MSIAFYMDEHVPRSITSGLRLRNIDILTADRLLLPLFIRANARYRAFLSL